MRRCDALAMSRSAGQSSASPPARRMARGGPERVQGPSCCACLFPLFSTRWRAVRFGVWGVDHPGAGRSPISGQFPEQIFPDSAPRPADKSVADRRRWATGRATTPATAAFQPMPNAADDATIPRSTQTSVGKQGSNPLPRLIARPKHVPAHNFNQTITILLSAQKDL
jgi:hypothetical protein